MEIERSPELLKKKNLEELYAGSVQRLHEYFIQGQGEKSDCLGNQVFQ